MSKFAERKEKNCLNCYREIHGRYCHVCGQENIQPKETVWHLVTHFVYDITHFDGKFFSTVKYLLLRPGFLSKEYIRGRRASYLNPVRMYVFISAFFFLFFFSLVNPYLESEKSSTNRKETGLDIQFKELKQLINDTANDRQARVRQQLKVLNERVLKLSADSLPDSLKAVKPGKLTVNYGQNYKSYREYDSLQKKLPPSERDNWLRRKATKKSIQIRDEYGDNVGSLMKSFAGRFVHYFPQIFFVSLPLFALLLQLLYVGRKNNYYVDHAIFSVHLYCAMFIFMFLLICMGKAEELPYLGWVDYLQWALWFYIVWYVYKALRNFYQQGRGKTFLKLFLLLLLDMFVMMFVSMVFLVVSLFSL